MFQYPHDKLYHESQLSAPHQVEPGIHAKSPCILSQNILLNHHLDNEILGLQKWEVDNWKL